MKNICIALCILSSSAISQTNIVIHGGMESTSPYFVRSDQPDFLGTSWSNGIDIGVGVEFALSKHFYVNPNIEYTYYKWSRYNFNGVMIPEWSIRSVEGDDSHIYRIMLESQYFPSPRASGLYLLTGFGYAIEKIGQIRRNIDDMNGPSFTVKLNYPNKNYWIHSFGAGFRANIIEKGGVDAKIKFFNDYNERCYISYDLGIVFSIGE